MPSRGPHFLGRNGERTPGRRFLPRDPLLWWGCGGGGCTSHLLPGLRPSHWNAGNGPSTGWAGWGRGQVPFGRRERNPFDFPLFPPVNKPLLLPARAGGRGHEALVLRPQARLQSDQPPSPVFPHQNGVPRGRNLLPLGVLSLFLQRNRALPGRAKFPSTAMEKAPHPPARRASPHSPSGEVFLWEQLKKILNIPLLVS